MSRIPVPYIQNHPVIDQSVVNPRTGKLECVAVNLEAVYPDPENPHVEFCFEELRAAKRGWLQQEWKQAPSPKHASPVQHRTPLQESPQKHNVSRVDDFDVGLKSHAPQLVRLNDENDENCPPETRSPAVKHTPARQQRKGDDNKTRKIRIRELKNETQTSGYT